jgi:hypothetical protein
VTVEHKDLHEGSRDVHREAVEKAKLLAQEHVVDLERESGFALDDDLQRIVRNTYATAYLRGSADAVEDYLATVSPPPSPTSPRDRFVKLTDPTNFLGTGLTLGEWIKLGNAEKMAASWSNQSREERKRRLDAVMRLSIELEHIRESTNFSTRLAELAIEAVIEGDWKMVEEWAEHFAFEDEHEQIRVRSAPEYVTFRELLLQALRAGKEAAA